MKVRLLLLLTGLLVCSSASAQVITNGLSIAAARKAMEAGGYKQTHLDMMPREPMEDLLQFWGVGQGVLIVEYSNSSKAITGLGLFLCDERPKALRREFGFDVVSFHAATGLMAIRTRKGEPGGAANPSQPTRSATNPPAAAAGSGR